MVPIESLVHSLGLSQKIIDFTQKSALKLFPNQLNNWHLYGYKPDATADLCLDGIVLLWYAKNPKPALKTLSVINAKYHGETQEQAEARLGDYCRHALNSFSSSSTITAPLIDIAKIMATGQPDVQTKFLGAITIHTENGDWSNIGLVLWTPANVDREMAEVAFARAALHSTRLSDQDIP